MVKIGVLDQFCNSFAIVSGGANVYKNEKSPIVLKLRSGRIRKQIVTGYSINPNHWDSDAQRVIKGTKDALLVNQKLESIEAIIVEVKLANGSMSDVLRRLCCSSIELRDYVQTIIDNLLVNGKAGNARIYCSFQKKITRSVLLKEIDEDYIQNFHKGLSKYADNTRLHYMRTFKAVINRAINDNLIVKNPFKKIKLFSPVKSRQSNYLSNEELNAIKNANDLSKRMTIVRNIFLFQYYCYGISFCDAADLTYNNISNNMILYTRHKTGTKMEIPISKDLHQLIVWFKNNTVLYNNRILPIMKTEYQETLQYHQCRQNKLTVFNANLRKLANTIGVREISSYYSRHSVAMQLRNNNVSIEIISQILGHSDITTTMHYLEAFPSDVILKAASCL